MWEDVALYAVFGALAGVVSGMFGVGGGIVIVPFPPSRTEFGI